MKLSFGTGHADAKKRLRPRNGEGDCIAGRYQAGSQPNDNRGAGTGEAEENRSLAVSTASDQ
jgi:hypothetical protein